MPCEYRMKNYCFHPERANGKLLAINCVYGWINKSIEEKNSRRLIQESATQELSQIL